MRKSYKRIGERSQQVVNKGHAIGAQSVAQNSSEALLTQLIKFHE